jgi:hypothetical protein
LSPYAILAGLAVLASAFGAGWGGAIKYRNGVDAKEKLELVQENSRRQVIATRNATRISDALTKDRLRSDRAARDATERLRQLADSVPAAAPGCPGRNDDPRPAAGVLSDVARNDLVALVEQAGAIADRLRACQAREVGPVWREPEGGRLDR